MPTVLEPSFQNILGVFLGGGGGGDIDLTPLSALQSNAVGLTAACMGIRCAKFIAIRNGKITTPSRGIKDCLHIEMST